MYQYLRDSLPGFSNLLGWYPSSCATQWRMSCQIPHDTGGGYSHFWCLIQEALTLHGMKSVQDIPQSLILVSIEGALAAIPKEDLLGQIRCNPRCDSPLGIFGNPHLQSSDLVSFHPCTSPV